MSYANCHTQSPTAAYHPNKTVPVYTWSDKLADAQDGASSYYSDIELMELPYSKRARFHDISADRRHKRKTFRMNSLSGPLTAETPSADSSCNAILSSADSLPLRNAYDDLVSYLSKTTTGRHGQFNSAPTQNRGYQESRRSVSKILKTVWKEAMHRGTVIHHPTRHDSRSLSTILDVFNHNGERTIDDLEREDDHYSQRSNGDQVIKLQFNSAFNSTRMRREGTDILYGSDENAKSHNTTAMPIPEQDEYRKSDVVQRPNPALKSHLEKRVLVSAPDYHSRNPCSSVRALPEILMQNSGHACSCLHTNFDSRKIRDSDTRRKTNSNYNDSFPTIDLACSSGCQRLTINSKSVDEIEFTAYRAPTMWKGLWNRFLGK